tara:strand:- start:1 stop:459 length:459 start_codon:yes stop_codon:yes gene_type:complete
MSYIPCPTSASDDMELSDVEASDHTINPAASSSTRDGAGPSSEVLDHSVEADAEEDAEAALDLKVARRMFWSGFALLPGIWLMVWLHYRGVAKQPRADPRLRLYVHRSMVGAACSGVLVACWVVVVQTQWRRWGESGRWLMAVAPPAEHDDW